MNHRNGNNHVAKDTKGRNTSQQPDDESQSAEEFRRDCHNRQKGRDVHHAGEEADRAAETVSTEPPERLLRTVREKHHSRYHRRNVTAASLSVTISLRIIESVSSQARLPDSWQTADKMKYTYMKILFVEVMTGQLRHQGRSPGMGSLGLRRRNTTAGDGQVGIYQFVPRIRTHRRACAD
jgi:hypothetical protein